MTAQSLLGPVTVQEHTVELVPSRVRNGRRG